MKSHQRKCQVAGNSATSKTAFLLLAITTAFTLPISQPTEAVELRCYPDRGYPKPTPGTLPKPITSFSQFFTGDPLPSVSNDYYYATFMMHELLGGGIEVLHNGLDLNAPNGTLIQPPYGQNVASVRVAAIATNAVDGLPVVYLARLGVHPNLGLFEYCSLAHVDTTGSGIYVGKFVTRSSLGNTSSVGRISGDHLHFASTITPTTTNLGGKYLANPLKYALATTSYAADQDNSPPVISQMDASSGCSATRHEFLFTVNEKFESYTVGPYQVELWYDGQLVDWTIFDGFLSKYGTNTAPSSTHNSSQRTGIYEFYAADSDALGSSTTGENPNQYTLSYCPSAALINCTSPPCWEVRAIDVNGNTVTWFRDSGCDGSTTAPIQDPKGEIVDSEVLITWSCDSFRAVSDYRIEAVPDALPNNVTQLGNMTAGWQETVDGSEYRFSWKAPLKGTGLTSGTYRIVYSPRGSSAQARQVQVIEKSPFQNIRLLVASNPSVGMAEFRLTGVPGTEVRLRAFDIQGRLVRDFGIQRLDSDGILNVIWDGMADSGARSSTGLYFIEGRHDNGQARARVLFLGSQ